jgi:putative FmdB family regulatory protein
MPIYAYRCDTCGHAKDVLRKVSDPLLTECPACGASTFRKQVTAAGFQLKGSGWYVTDFKSSGAAPAPAADKAAEKPADKPADGAAKPADGAAPAAGASTGTPSSTPTGAPAPAPSAAPAPAPSSGSGSGGEGGTPPASKAAAPGGTGPSRASH